MLRKGIFDLLKFIKNETFSSQDRQFLSSGNLMKCIKIQNIFYPIRNVHSLNINEHFFVSITRSQLPSQKDVAVNL
jgi:hypothetical protein